MCKQRPAEGEINVLDGRLAAGLDGVARRMSMPSSMASTLPMPPCGWAGQAPPPLPWPQRMSPGAGRGAQ